MITILTGGIKNVGDYLIGDRAKKLLEKYVDEEIVELSRFDSMEPHLNTINRSRALVLCGGPAYTKDIYEGVYRLDKVIDKIKVPIIPFGLGWSGKPFGFPDKFKFTDASLAFLEKIHAEINESSCRDVITHKILADNKLENVVMTGCPVWYDLESIGNSFPEEFNPKKIVITTPASPLHILLNTKLVSLIKHEFPDVKVILSFHRGIKRDKHTSLKNSIGYQLMAWLAKRVDNTIEVRDVSYDLSKIDFYKTCDFHIGFRVHAHLYFLSRRLPSILINEDGRGEGMIKSLGQTIYNVTHNNLKNQLRSHITLLKDQNLEEYATIKKIIDATFIKMQSFLNNLDNEIK